MTGWRLAFDLQATQSSAHWDRGVARYVKEHVRALLRRGAGEALLLNPHLPFPRRLEHDLLTSPLLGWNTQSELRRVAERADGPIAYHHTSPFEMGLRSEGDLPPHTLRGDVPVLATVYDLIPMRMMDRPPWDDPKLVRRYRTRVETFHHLDLLLTISEHTRRDVIELVDVDPRKVVNVGAGVSSFFRPFRPGDPAPPVDGPYVFCQSGASPSKNTDTLFDAWALLPRDIRSSHRLVVTCSLDDGTRARWGAALDERGIAGEVVLTDHVPEDALRALYQHAAVVVVPSLYEGFGFPVAEAMACGTAVVTSRTSSLPEILDLPEATFDPTDAGAIAATIDTVLQDDARRRAIAAHGASRAPVFTWDAVATRTLDAISAVIGPPSSERTSLPWRLAVVGPMPPTASGIADYNARLVPALARRCEVDLFTPGSRPPKPLHPNVRWLPPRALKEVASPWSYDAVLYTIGNSDDHHELYELAQELPGVLWMHDVRIPGLYLTYAADRLEAPRGDEFLRDRLLRQYRRRTPLHIDWTTSALWPEWNEFGLGMSKELVDVARAVIVSSTVAARLLALDQQPDAHAMPPVSVLPLAAPPVGAGERVATRGAIVCFGMVAPVKAPELLITALASVPDATLTFVGPVGDGYRAVLEELVSSLGLADRVAITGRVSEDEYRDWLQRGALAVQLRRDTNGESSAAVMDCLAAGIPVVTNLPAAAELPEGTVATVPWDVDAVTLASVARALLEDDGGLGARGQAYAASWTFDDVAAAVLDVVRSLPPTLSLSPR